MDLWIVAAATGAGYLAKYWKNQSRDGDALSQLSFGDSSLVSSEFANHLHSNFARRSKRYEDVFAYERVEGTSSDKNPLDIPSAAELDSISGFENEKMGILGNYQEFNEFSIPNMPMKFWVNENRKQHIGGSGISGKMADDFEISVCNSPRRIGSLHGTGRNRSTIETGFSHGNLIKPLSSFEDCLMTPGKKEQTKMEDRDPTFRPFFETSKSRKSSLRPHIVMEEPKGAHFDDNENVCGVSQLPFMYLETLDSVNKKTGKGWERKSRSSSKTVNRKQSDTEGSPDESFILYLGIFIGMIFSFISNKREIHKLNELLKPTDNLVQDLQEELEMKDLLKVKELVNDNGESQHTFSNAFSEKTGDESSPKHVTDYSMKFDVKELYEQKAEASSESMSRIEAELEAELERLGLNISTHSMERFSGMDELDPEFIEEFAEGELRNDMISGQNSPWRRPNQEASDSTAQSGNYAVSPRELSLRLHDVIQSRLEARVKELEIALQNKQRKLQLINTEYENSWLELENDGLQSSSNEKSPTPKDESRTVPHPLVMDLSNEAINGFHCSHEQLRKMRDSEEAFLPS